MTQHVLWIPRKTEEPVLGYTFNSSKHTVVQALLEEHGDGFYVQFDLEVDGEFGGRLAFLASEGHRNPRAERVLTFLTAGTVMEITGDACFSNIDPALVEAVASGKF